MLHRHKHTLSSDLSFVRSDLHFDEFQRVVVAFILEPQNALPMLIAVPDWTLFHVGTVHTCLAAASSAKPP